MSFKQNILTPVARIVQGSLYEAQDKDMSGNPLVAKTGTNAGQARLNYFFAVAIPKGPEAAWWDTEWGKIIAGVGFAAFPQAAANPRFAWKVIDGDSQVPNEKGRKPCDQEGFRGHWVLRFSSGYPPKIVNADGTQQITEPNAVKPGYYVQVFGNVDGNGQPTKPGVYLNHIAVSFVGYGPEIVYGPDLSSVGFGKGVALPPGASATPVAGAFNPGQMPAAPGTPGAPMAPGVPAVPGAPMAPAAPQMPAAAAPHMPAAPGAPMAPGGAPQVPVVPHHGILQPPGAAPTMPAAPAAAPVRQLTAKAAGYSYEQLIAGGWTDETLRAAGLML